MKTPLKTPLKTLFLAWQNPISRAWFPIGRLTFDGETYRFGYIQGALVAQQQGDFKPVWAFPDLHGQYESPQLFPLFANRLMRHSRPDYPDFVEWLNIPKDEDDPIALLARSGGQRATDNFEVFPCPERDEKGLYHIHFFAHGSRHLPDEMQQRIQKLALNERLYIAFDMQNPYDPKALLLRTEDMFTVGYCPRYLTSDVLKLLLRSPQKLTLLVERVNLPPSPHQLRLLCNLTADWSEGFQPFNSDSYKPLVAEVAASELAQTH